MTTIPIYYYISQNHTADLVNPQCAMPLRTHLATTDHYPKICLFRAPNLCRGSTHGIKSYAVSKQVQPTAKQKLTAYLTTAHGEV
jgi:hypothetical protein